jgi:predicted small lipoprotein YifL
MHPQTALCAATHHGPWQLNIDRENNMRNKGYLVMVLCAVLAAGITACEKKGPVEQAAEEVDEAIDTAKNGGKEPVADKVDDAVDELRK